MATTPKLAACAGTWGVTQTGVVTCSGDIRAVENPPLSTLTFAQAGDLVSAALVVLATAAAFRLLAMQLLNR